ncbi:MAG: hypothetical protein ACFFDN_45785 [Candidatus Hodarchaeota archaeon]
MRFTVEGINVNELLKLNQGFDTHDCLILRHIIDLIQTGKMASIIWENQKYYRIKYQKALESLPTLQIRSREGFRKRMLKYEKCGLMQHVTLKMGGTYSYYRFTEKVKALVTKYDPKEEKKKEKGLKQKLFPKKKKIFVVTPVDKSSTPVVPPVNSSSEQSINLLYNESINEDISVSGETGENNHLKKLKPKQEENIFPVRELEEYTLRAAQILKDNGFPVKIPRPDKPVTKTLLRFQEYLMQLKDECFERRNMWNWEWKEKGNIRFKHEWYNNIDKILEDLEFAAKRYQGMKKDGIWPEKKKILTDNIALWMYSEKNEKSWFMYCMNNEPRKIEDRQVIIDRIKNSIFVDDLYLPNLKEIEKEAAEKFRLPDWDEEKYWLKVKEMYEWWRTRRDALQYYNNDFSYIKDFDDLLAYMKKYRKTWSTPWVLGNFGLMNKTWNLFATWLKKEVGFNLNVDDEDLLYNAQEWMRRDGVKIQNYEELRSIVRRNSTKIARTFEEVYMETAGV